MNVANKAWRTRGFCLVAATVLAVVGAWTLREPLFALATHGLTWDERMENRSLRQQVETFDRHWHPQDYAGRPEKPYLAYHGVVNKLPGLFLWRIAQVARGEPPGDFMMGETMLVGMHLSCLLFLLVTVWAVHGCALAWSGSTAVARLAALLLLLHPRFVGQAFFNVKDVPFAALYTLVTWGTVAMVRAVDDGGVRRGFVRALVAASLLAATKIVGAVATWPLVAAAWWPARLASQTPSRGLRGAATFAPLAVVLFAIFATPAAWLHPVDWVRGSLGFFQHHPWSHCTMTLGYCASAASLPRTYLPVWFAVTTPLLHVAAAGSALLGWRTLPRGTFAVLAQIVTLPILSIATAAPLYDAERQFLFVIPAWCVVGALGLARLASGLSVRPAARRIAVAVAASAMAVVAVDSVRLHPYQYAYFNEVGRWLRPSENFETDYWGFSLAELTKRHRAMLRVHPAWQGTPLAGQPLDCVAPFAGSAGPVLPENRAWLEEWPPELAAPVRVLAIPRFAWRTVPDVCEVVDTIERRLLFAPEPLLLSRAMVCRPGSVTR